MKKVLLAVDNCKGSEQAVQALAGWAKGFQPESVLLIHVERLYGPSIVGEALESELDIEEVNRGFEYHIRIMEQLEELRNNES